MHRLRPHHCQSRMSRFEHTCVIVFVHMCPDIRHRIQLYGRIEKRQVEGAPDEC